MIWGTYPDRLTLGMAIHPAAPSLIAQRADEVAQDRCQRTVPEHNGTGTRVPLPAGTWAH